MSDQVIRDAIHAAWERMTAAQRRLWEALRIDPEKWQQHPWGDAGGGFWVVGLIGRTVIWYNDIEGGFNRSRYSQYGEIGAYWCNEDELEGTVQHLLNEIETGQPSGTYSGPPEPIR